MYLLSGPQISRDVESGDSCGKLRQIILLEYKKFWLLSLVSCYHRLSDIGSHRDLLVYASVNLLEVTSVIMKRVSTIM